MRYRCMCLVIHAPDDLRVDVQEASDPGPGEVLVAVGFGGICGSDLHYFHHGGFGSAVPSSWRHRRCCRPPPHPFSGTRVSPPSRAVSWATPGRTSSSPRAVK